jgi:hypothetical protein
MAAMAEEHAAARVSLAKEHADAVDTLWGSLLAGHAAVGAALVRRHRDALERLGSLLTAERIQPAVLEQMPESSGGVRIELHRIEAAGIAAGGAAPGSR